MPILIRPAQVGDAAAMACCMVDTFLTAHRGHMPDEVWQRRHDEWTYDVSAAAWARTIAEIAAGNDPGHCIYLAVDEQRDAVVGLAMGCPPTVTELENAGEVCQLYVRVDYQHQGLGRRLLQAVAGNLAQQGKRALLIPVLAANAPARQFYEAMGGQLVGERDFEDYGFILPEVVYGWPDLRALAG